MIQIKYKGSGLSALSVSKNAPSISYSFVQFSVIIYLHRAKVNLNLLFPECGPPGTAFPPANAQPVIFVMAMPAAFTPTWQAMLHGRATYTICAPENSAWARRSQRCTPSSSSSVPATSI